MLFGQIHGDRNCDAQFILFNYLLLEQEDKTNNLIAVFED